MYVNWSCQSDGEKKIYSDVKGELDSRITKTNKKEKLEYINKIITQFQEWNIE